MISCYASDTLNGEQNIEGNGAYQICNTTQDLLRNLDVLATRLTKIPGELEDIDMRLIH